MRTWYPESGRSGASDTALNVFEKANIEFAKGA